jgi:hypothetical protein
MAGHVSDLPMKKYEYRVLQGKAINEGMLNRLGREGFRIVATPRFSAEGYVAKQTYSCILEREIGDEPMDAYA